VVYLHGPVIALQLHLCAGSVGVAPEQFVRSELSKGLFG
jgi:hypothetical protein